jgi:hypothetical protein
MDRMALRVGLLLAVPFVVRLALANRNSYWLDELLSVTTYGVDNKSLPAAVARLAQKSIHPPLYQIVLYGWMQLFGTTEIATRTLSNLYITGAALFTFLTVRRAMGVRRGALVALCFSVTYLPFLLSLETRSYGQSFFLSALSTWVLVDFLEIAARDGGRAMLRSRPLWLLALVNAGLLLTHYFNGFFLAAQGLFALVWIAARSRRAGLTLTACVIGPLARAAVGLALPLVLLLLSWGSSLKRVFQGQGSRIMSADTVKHGPVELFSKTALWPGAPLLLQLALLLIGIALLTFFVADARRRAPSRPERFAKSSMAWYALSTGIGSFAVAWLLIPSAAHEFEPKYFAPTIAPLAVLLVLGFEQLLLLTGHALKRARLVRWYVKRPALFALLLLLILLPGTYRAAAKTKADWRGTAQLIDQIVREDPDHRYVVYGTGFTHYPSLNYYFKRFDAKARVDRFIRRGEDARAKRVFDRHEKKNKKYDFLILAFSHLRAEQMPKTIKELSSRYTLHERRLQPDGRGIIIFRLQAPKD